MPLVKLTEDQISFIEANRNRLTYSELSLMLGFDSVHYVREYCQQAGLTKSKIEELTDEQKDFIRENYKKLPFQRIIKEAGLKSRYKLYQFLREENMIHPTLTETQQEFIRQNYLTMAEKEMAEKIGVTRFSVQKFKREEGLVRNEGNKKARLIEGMFDVDERENWVA